MNFVWNMENWEYWNSEKNYYALLLPLKAHKSIKGLSG